MVILPPLTINLRMGMWYLQAWELWQVPSGKDFSFLTKRRTRRGCHFSESWCDCVRSWALAWWQFLATIQSWGKDSPRKKGNLQRMVEQENRKKRGSQCNCMPDFYNPLGVAHQSPLSTGFPRQEYWSGLSFPSPEELPDPGIKLGSPAL